MHTQKIAIIGRGYVGRALEEFFKDKFDIVIYDPPQGFSDKKAINKCDLAVVSVPTVMKKDGTADLSIIEETFSWLTVPRIVIKSTVPPGTTAALAKKYHLQKRLVFSPEFIGEGGYPVPHWEGVPHATDMRLHKALIFGGEREAVENVIPFFARVRGPFGEYHSTDSTTAELTKYMENAWIATKVTFCNEFYDLAREYGVSYNELRELWLTDGRVGRSHTLVYPHKRGFEGKCIPKDTTAIYLAAKKRGFNATFLDAILRKNAALRKEKVPYS